MRWRSGPGRRGSGRRWWRDAYESAGVTIDQPVEITEGEGRIVIQARPVPTVSIEVLTAGITEQNRHDCIDSGLPVGQEAW